MAEEGLPVTRELASKLSPYTRDHLRRFGELVRPAKALGGLDLFTAHEEGLKAGVEPPSVLMGHFPVHLAPELLALQHEAVHVEEDCQGKGTWHRERWDLSLHGLRHIP